MLRVIINNADYKAAVVYLNEHAVPAIVQDLYDYFDTDLNKYAFYLQPSHSAIQFAKRFNTTTRII